MKSRMKRTTKLGAAWRRLGIRQDQLLGILSVYHVVSSCSTRGHRDGTYAVTHSGCYQSPDAPASIVQAQGKAAAIYRTELSYQRRCCCLAESHTEANNESTSNKHSDIHSRTLNNTSDASDNGRQGYSLLPASPVDNETREEGCGAASHVRDAGVECFSRCCVQ
jgi:hypothetical protein